MNYLIKFFLACKKSIFKRIYIQIKKWLHLVINYYYLIKFLGKGTLEKYGLKKDYRKNNI